MQHAPHTTQSYTDIAFTDMLLYLPLMLSCLWNTTVQGPVTSLNPVETGLSMALSKFQRQPPQHHQSAVILIAVNILFGAAPFLVVKQAFAYCVNCLNATKRKQVQFPLKHLIMATELTDGKYTINPLSLLFICQSNGDSEYKPAFTGVYFG